jgi:hypothetical protein
LARLTYFYQKGDDALAGREEKNIASHRFDPDNERDRTIAFQGSYLSIFNQKTQHRATFQEEVKEYTPYPVPKGYTVYVRGVERVSFTG